MGSFSTWYWLIITLILVVPALLFSRIISKAGLSSWWAIVGLVPFVNLLSLWVFAFSKWPAFLGADDARPESRGRRLIPREMPSITTNFVLGAIFLGVGFFAVQAGVFPIFGLLVAAFGPNIFLIGLVLIAIGIARLLFFNRIAISLLAVTLSIAAGLNTRLPVFILDLSSGKDSQTQLVSRLEGAAGQPIHIVAETPVISARRYKYAHAVPACYGDSCLATKGFRTPYPWIERDYWHEKVVDVTLAAGFSNANPGEQAFTLTVTQTTEAYFSDIHIDLVDAKGELLARYDGRYRNGFPMETEDGVTSEAMSRSLVFEYLLHGNLLNSMAARLIPGAEAYPLASFLKSVSNLAHPQGSTLGLISGRPSAGSEPPSIKAALEILEEKTYDPVWIIKKEPMSDVSKWSEMAWDKVRWDRCKNLLKPETKGAPLMQTWHLFVNDPSGRKKVRYAGDAICDPDAIWFMDYVIENGRMVLTKYAINGDLIYRVSFEKPAEPWGFAGGILIPTFKAQDGYLYFEWWNTNQSGLDRHVKRSMQVRLREPVDTPNIAVEGDTPLVTLPLASRPSP